MLRINGFSLNRRRLLCCTGGQVSSICLISGRIPDSLITNDEACMCVLQKDLSFIISNRDSMINNQKPILTFVNESRIESFHSKGFNCASLAQRASVWSNERFSLWFKRELIGGEACFTDSSYPSRLSDYHLKLLHCRVSIEVSKLWSKHPYNCIWKFELIPFSSSLFLKAWFTLKR